MWFWWTYHQSSTIEIYANKGHLKILNLNISKSILDSGSMLNIGLVMMFKIMQIRHIWQFHSVLAWKLPYFQLRKGYDNVYMFIGTAYDGHMTTRVLQFKFMLILGIWNFKHDIPKSILDRHTKWSAMALRETWQYC